MKCASCGHEIADNAIVCYRCGAPTARPVADRSDRPTPRRAGPRPMIVAAVIALILAALAVGLAWHLL